MAQQIEIEDMITAGALAEKLMIPVTKLISELFKNGVMVTVNERIDFDTAEIIVGELGLDVELKRKAEEVAVAPPRERHQASDKAVTRPPVVAVMGHVDHGKTSLLDAIRTSEVTKGEAGGITQHISAYQVEHNKRKITFLDTPGHEAFAALREHGAQLTDVAIIVIAADDGIKPQTLEAIRFAQKAGVKMIVAMNKIDKEGADENRVKQQLSENNLMPEEWGGDTIIVPVSAKTKKGVPELLDMILLVADVEELKADVDMPASGLVIESHMEQGRGPVAIALVENGTLKSNDFIVAGATYGKIKNLESTDGTPIKEATPSTPVIISGFRNLPEFGDTFTVAPNEKAARALAEEKSRATQGGTGKLDVNTSSQLMHMINRNMQLQELPVIVKADVQGSLTSVIDSLKSLDNEEVAIRIVGTGVGAVNDTDIHMAHSGKAIIYGFNVSMPNNVKQIANRDKVPVRLYKVIYELIDDAKEELTQLLSPEVVETDLGRLVVKGVFKTTKTEIICGGEVTKGKIVPDSLARVSRDGADLGAVEITLVKRGPSEAKEVFEGEMCGLQLKTENKIELQEGDKIDVFTREVVARKL